MRLCLSCLLAFGKTILLRTESSQDEAELKRVRTLLSTFAGSLPFKPSDMAKLRDGTESLAAVRQRGSLAKPDVDAVGRYGPPTGWWADDNCPQIISSSSLSVVSDFTQNFTFHGSFWL